MLEEIDRARVRLAEVLTLLSARERDLKAADSKKGEVERECERLEEEMRMISEMLTDKKECLRDKENEMQASTAESAKCKEELKEVEISLASIYKAYEADRHREEDMKRRLNLLDTEEQDLMENQQRIKSSVDMMRSEVEDFHQEMKELDLQLEGKRRSVEEMKAEERTQIMSIEREKRKLTSIRESAAEEIALLTELRDKVTLTKTDLKSAETDLSDVTTELKFKLDEIEEHQTKFENDQTVERKKLEKGLLELERVAGMVRNEENRLFSLSAEHDTLMKEVCSLKEVESNLERSVIQLSETVRELREVISVREAEKHGLEREIYTQQMKQTIEIDKLHSLSAAIDQKNSSLTLTESDTVRAVKKLNEMKSLCKAEERIICHQRLQLKCCLDEMLVYETKLKEKAVIVRARGQGSPEVPPALRSEQESGSESGRDLKWRE